MQVACVAQQTAGISSTETYQEDLRMERIHFEEAKKSDSSKSNAVEHKQNYQDVPATYAVNTKVNSVLDSLDKLNQFRKFIDGYTIQIYSGQNREEAITARSKMVTEANDLTSNLQYTQPKFRVTAGQYYSRLEAQKDLMRVKKIFPNAILVPEKISIR